MPWNDHKKGWYLETYGDGEPDRVFFISGKKAGNFWIDEDWEEGWGAILWNCLPRKGDPVKHFSSQKALVKAIKSPIFKKFVAGALPTKK